MADYPDTLPDFKIGKKRIQRQTFEVVYPLQGTPYNESKTEDEPWVMEVQIVCKSLNQAKDFQAWLKTVRRGQIFKKSILTEEGRENYMGGWLVAPLKPQQPETSVFIYSGTIYAKELTPVT